MLQIKYIRYGKFPLGNEILHMREGIPFVVHKMCVL